MLQPVFKILKGIVNSGSTARWQIEGVIFEDDAMDPFKTWRHLRPQTI